MEKYLEKENCENIDTGGGLLDCPSTMSLGDFECIRVIIFLLLFFFLYACIDVNS